MTEIRRMGPEDGSWVDAFIGNEAMGLYFTVEAFSLDQPDAATKRWIGINQTDVPGYVPRLPDRPFSSTERAIRHLRELAASLADHDRAVILYCLYYENTGFRYYYGTTYDEVMRTVQVCRDAGVELWQAAFEPTTERINLRHHYQLKKW